MTTTLTTSIREDIAGICDSAAAFRERVAEGFPEDTRNARAAKSLRALAEELRAGQHDDDPALQRLATLGADLYVWHSDDDFDVSRYGFNAPPNAGAFLDAFANAVARECGLNLRKQESRYRRMAAKLGLKLTKLRRSSGFYDQYGPYMLVDERNYVVAHGLDIDRVAQELEP